VAALSFLGVGVQPPFADWGGMVRRERRGDQFRAAGAAVSGDRHCPR